MLPAIVHMRSQLVNGDRGPSVLVLAPTRELVQQINTVTSQFCENAGCAFGGGGRQQQIRMLRGGRLHRV